MSDSIPIDQIPPLAPGDYYDVSVDIPVLANWEEDEDTPPTAMDAVRVMHDEVRATPLDYWVYRVQEVHGGRAWIVDPAQGWAREVPVR